MTENNGLFEHGAKLFAADKALHGMGISVSTPAPGEAIATMTVTEGMLNGFDICHGGYVFALADTAFAYACNDGDRVTVAAGAQIDFLHPVGAEEKLTATATVRAQGGRAGVYDVSVVDSSGREVAVFRGRAQRLSKSFQESQGQ